MIIRVRKISITRYANYNQEARIRLVDIFVRINKYETL